MAKESAHLAGLDAADIAHAKKIGNVSARLFYFATIVFLLE